MPIKKGHHCAYDTHYHLVFTVKYRRALLTPALVDEMVRVGREIEQRYEIEIECFGADKNHVHLLCSAHPKVSPGQIARIYKSIWSIWVRELFKTFPQLKKELWGGQFWSDGYYVANCAERGNWTALVRYVKNQGLKPEDINLRLVYPEPSLNEGLGPEPLDQTN